MKSPSSVNEHDINTFINASLNGLVSDGGRIGARVLADGTHTDAFSPRLQLLASGGAEGVCCTEEDRLSLGDENARQLAAGRRLTRAIDAHHEDDSRLAFQAV